MGLIIGNNDFKKELFQINSDKRIILIRNIYNKMKLSIFTYKPKHIWFIRVF